MSSAHARAFCSSPPRMHTWQARLTSTPRIGTNIRSSAAVIDSEASWRILEIALVGCLFCVIDRRVEWRRRIFSSWRTLSGTESVHVGHVQVNA